nr:putative ribonuclease H-like domain-containing protein [Tanacetum cinerariifolium]
MTDKYFVEYTRVEVKQFRETLLQHMSNVNKFVAERTRHQRQYDRRVNKRQIQKQESKIDMGKAFDASLVVMECSGTESGKHDTSSMLENDANADNAYIKPVYGKEPMAETKDHNDSLIAQMNKKSIENADLKAQIQKKVFAIASLKNELRKLKGNIVDTKFAKRLVLGKSVLQPFRNQSVVRKPTAYKSKRPKISKPRWKPMGRILKTVGLRWVPIGNKFDSCTSKDDSDSTHGSNVDISKIHECKLTLDLSVGTSINVQKKQSTDLSARTSYNVNKENLKVWLLKKLISLKPVLKENQVVSKSSAVTTADASDKRQQQLDSTSSTSTLAKIITSDGNFDLVANQEETPSLDNILSLTNRFEDILGVSTSSDEMIGVEADVSNMETAISASPTPTLRIHKDHPKMYQMDVKSAFLYGTIDEEVYVMQPPGFQDTTEDFILIQVYMDDIIFRSSNPQLYREFEALMHEKFQMSAMGELNFFIGLQVLQKEDGIFLSQDKYTGDILKKFRFSDASSDT